MKKRKGMMVDWFIKAITPKTVKKVDDYAIKMEIVGVNGGIKMDVQSFLDSQEVRNQSEKAKDLEQATA